MRRVRLTRRLAVTSAVAVAGLLAAILAPATAHATAPGKPAATDPAAPVPTLDWRPCDGGFQCATARVPLDYQYPHGQEINIAVIRHLATGPGTPLGSLFFNGGGPTAQISDFPTGYAAFPAVLQARYNIITFDPRGFGDSTGLQCFPAEAAEDKLLGSLPAFPVGAAQEAAWERTWSELDATCATNAGPLLDHDTTADVARDMNLLREAVGDPVLNYYGQSYGTFLGTVYANLFPATVGRMVLDGNIDPVAWTQADSELPGWLRLGRAQASAATLTDFLNLCGSATAAACAFSAGTPAATRAKFATLLNLLRQHPVTASTPPQTYTYASALTSVPVGKVSQWPSGASVLEQLWKATTAGSATSPAAASTASAGNAAGAQPAQAAAPYSGIEQQLGEICSDSPNPRDPQAYPGIAARSSAQSGGFGPDYTWQAEECAQWPAAAAQDRYTGPWNRRTAGTILLLGNTGDPNTPYQNSVALSHELGNARLLTVKGYGHTEAGNPSTCADNYLVNYALTGALPPAGTICAQNGPPFPLPSHS